MKIFPPNLGQRPWGYLELPPVGDDDTKIVAYNGIVTVNRFSNVAVLLS